MYVLYFVFYAVWICCKRPKCGCHYKEACATLRCKNNDVQPSKDDELTDMEGGGSGAKVVSVKNVKGGCKSEEESGSAVALMNEL